jgi:hypothetical protein
MDIYYLYYHILKKLACYSSTWANLEEFIAKYKIIILKVKEITVKVPSKNI